MHPGHCNFIKNKIYLDLHANIFLSDEKTEEIRDERKNNRKIASRVGLAPHHRVSSDQIHFLIMYFFGFWANFFFGGG